MLASAPEEHAMRGVVATEDTCTFPVAYGLWAVSSPETYFTLVFSLS